ncbi:MAG: hypothetical protein C5B58_08720 [Acidobacteria bacterium]|nr:MAG: hypothetical protein C5B58_08720 [Acidobacteriota bacterium]
MAPLLPALIDKSPEYCLALILQRTRQLLAEHAPNLGGRKSLHVLDLALLNAIDDLEQVAASTQVIQSEAKAVSELTSNDRQEHLQAALRALEQNTDTPVEHPGIEHLKWLLSIATKKPQPRKRDRQAH